MDCQCCGAQVGPDKKYVVFALKHGVNQVAICKGCMVIGMRAESGSIIVNKKVVMQPKLAFPYKSNRAEFCKVARKEGWLTQSIPGDAVEIEAHLKQALIGNYFVPGEGWRKNVSIASVECFRRSCANIRDYYPQWLALKAGK